MEYHDLFSLDDNELGCASQVKHNIKVTDDEPFKERFRHIPPPLLEEIRMHVNDMLQAGAIRPSSSPWCNAVVLIWKKDGGLRFCIDFRKLNARAKKDSYPLPHIQEMLESLEGSRIFSSFDFKSGFWQVEMDEASKQYTTFTVGSLGFFECEHMPFRLCNMPATFQRLMQNCLGELNLTYCLIYLDDVITFSTDEDDHLRHMRVIFDRFRAEHLKLKPSKCSLFRDKIVFLAHCVTKDGIQPSEEHMKAITNFPEPDSYTSIRRFVGMVGHFRHFIAHFAHLVRPLNNHLEGDASKLKAHKVTLSWKAKEAFGLLKQALLQAPVLKFADYSKPFVLETDASSDGLGAVLLQEGEDGKLHPIAYGSRSLTKAKRNYHSGKTEFLALKWAVTDHFKEYLIYQPFVVCTDNNPLTYLFTTPNLDACGHRWVASLANFNFTIEYQRGRYNAATDTLSQMNESLNAQEVKAILDEMTIGCSNRAELSILAGRRGEEEERVWVSAAHVPKEEMHVINWLKAQNEDPVIRGAIEWMQSGKEKSLKHHLGTLASTPEGLGFISRQKSLVLVNSKLYLKCKLKGEAETTIVFIIPKAHRRKTIDGCHRDTGHQGQNRTASLLLERFWWPGMTLEVKSAVKNCKQCLRHDGDSIRAPLVPIEAMGPMDLLHLDFTKIKVSGDHEKELKKKPEVVNVLVVTDHFT